MDYEWTLDNVYSRRIEVRREKLETTHLTTHDKGNDNKGKYGPKMKNRIANEAKFQRGCLLILKEEMLYKEWLFQV